MNQKNPSDPYILEQIKTRRSFRRKLAMESHYWFFHIYFGHYIKHSTADFQKKIFEITQDPKIRLAVIAAFRGSAKSTIVSLSLPIWAMVGNLQKKFVVITSLTANQSRLLLTAIKTELETNQLLINDFGPFEEDDQEWRSNSLVIKKFGTRISAFSTGESIRGSRHNQFRPDLIICDDIEDLASVKTRESRDKTYRWLLGDLIPAGDKNTKVIVIGNLLHEDSVICRMEDDISAGSLKAVFRKYPLLDAANRILWPGKYPDHTSIKELQAQVANDQAWHREYLLHIISDEERVIHPEWINYYDHLPEPCRPEGFVCCAMAIDVAISTKESADETAIVMAQIHKRGNDLKIYILPNVISKRMLFPDVVELVTEMYKVHRPVVYVENVGYQDALTQQLRKQGVDATGVNPGGIDKRSRLAMISHLIKDGTVLFPAKGCEGVIQQMVGFGVEKHDDQVDALSMLVSRVVTEPPRSRLPIKINTRNFNRSSFSSRSYKTDWADREDEEIFNNLKRRKRYRKN